MNKELYLEKYENFKIPNSLGALVDFSLKNESFFSSGFEVEPENIKYMYESYSAEKEFTDSFICIGSADGAGSEYAFWLKNGNDLTDAPIVAFGGEGGYHIVAQNFDELLRLLTVDIEPMVDWDGVDFYKDEANFEPSQSAEKFRDWVKENIKVGIIHKDEEVIQIMDKAKEAYQAELNNWVGKFYKD